MNKRILASLITTLLIASVLAIPTPNVQAAKYDELIDTISPTSGKALTVITVNGTAPQAISADSPVLMYISASEPTAQTTEYGYGYGEPTKLNWQLVANVTYHAPGNTNVYEVGIYAWPLAETIYIIAWQDKNDNGYVDDGEWDYESFTVLKGISPSLDKGAVGTPLCISGFGFKPYAKVDIYFDANNDSKYEPEELQTHAWANENGGFLPYCFDVPTVKNGYGNYTVYVTDGENYYTVVFTVEKPVISITPDKGAEGTVIFVEVNYFTRNETAGTLQIFFDANGNEAPDAGDAITSTTYLYSTGGWTTTLKVPSGLSYGVYKVIALNELGEKATANFTVLAPDFEISLDKETITIPQGGSGTVTVTLKALAGYDKKVTLNATVEPEEEGIEISFEPEEVTPTADGVASIMSILVGANVPPGTYTINVTGTGEDDKVHNATLKLTVEESLTPNAELISKVVSKATGEEISEGPVGISLIVKGTAPDKISSDNPVKIYWSKDDKWSSDDKLLATVNEPASEDKPKYYEATITTPTKVSLADKTGYIIARYKYEFDSSMFTLTEDYYPKSGHVGDEVVIGGWDYLNPGGKITVYWNTQDPENKLAEVYSFGAYDGSYSITITVPETTCGDYAIIVVEESPTQTHTYVFTVNPEITLSPTTAIPGDTINVTGTGFSAESKITLYFDGEEVSTTPSEVKTDANGSFSCKFKVPDGAAMGSHTVKAEDEEGNSDTATLTIGPAITISPTSGPTGTIVEISGRGFDEGAGKNITVTIDGKECPVLDEIKVKSDGTFTGKFVIPTVDADEYTITAAVFDMPDVSATASFEVTGKTSITLKPKSGAPGSTVTIEGVNFVAKADVEVTITFGGMELTEKAKTNSTGGFIASFTVPSVAIRSEPYIVNATDEYGLSATAEFRVAMTTLAISPSSGPTGKKIMLLGGGLTPEKAFNVTIDGKLMIYEESDAVTTSEGNIPEGFVAYVPTLPVGKHTITVMDEEGVTASAEFEVTETTEIVLTPSSAPQGYNVTFELKNFIGKSGVSIDITIYNVTATGEISWKEDLSTAVGTGNFTAKDIETDSSGCFKDGWFVVPGTLAIGDYYINATDEYGLTASASFKVVEPTVNVETGADEYMPGDTVTFFANCTFSYEEVKINLYTPSGLLFKTVPIAITTKVGEIYTGTATCLLPADAEIGEWLWNTTISGVTVEGTFNVTTKVTTGTLEQRLLKLKSDVSSLADVVDKLKDMVSDQASSISTLSGSVSALSDSVSSLKRDVTSLADVVDKLRGMVSDQASSISSLKSSVSTLSGSVSALSDSVSSLKRDVTSLADVVDKLRGMVSDQASSISSLKSSVSTLSDTVSSLAHDVKDLSSAISAAQSAAKEASEAASSAQVAVSGLQMAVYGAVILSLIAAVAAIISIIIVQRKIAG